MDDFNNQGRDKLHVENNYKVAFYATAIFLTIIGILSLYALFIKSI
jgi:hypothetical protein